MERSHLSHVIEDYLKCIYHLLRDKGKANTNELAKMLKVSAPTVTQMIKKLSEAKLVTHEPYRGVVLTPAGEKIALEIIRHHRLIEKYLHEALGMSWDKVHEEADRWEHVISEEVERLMDEVLNYPKHDPHGSPIPDRRLKVEEEKLVPLADLAPGQCGEVREVPDEDAGLLQYLSTLGITPTARFRVEGKDPYGGPLVLSMGGRRVRIGLEAAALVRVRPVGGGR